MAKRLRGSVTVTAMVTTTVLLLIGTALINLVYFSMTTSERESEILRGKWFLEGRVQEYFDGVMSGDTVPEPGKRRYQEQIEGRKESYTLEIQLKQGSYRLHAAMRWKNRYNIEQAIDFSRLNVFDYAVFFRGNNEFRLDQNMLVFGNVGVQGNLKILNRPGARLYFYADQEFSPSVFYSGEQPVLDADFFDNSLPELIARPSINIDFNLRSLNSRQFLRSQTGFKDVKMPTFDDIWKAFSPYYDSAWFINDTTFFDTEEIVNYVSSEKELLAFGNGSATRFDAYGRKFFHVYIKSPVQSYEIQNISSVDYAYFTGYNNRSQFFGVERGTLILKASEQAISILLPDEAYQRFGTFLLKGPEWSFLSRSEYPEQVFLNSVQPFARLLPGVDFYYNPESRSIEIISEAFYRSHTDTLGYGSGNQSTYSYKNYGGRVYIYQGWERSAGFTTYLGTLVFDAPPRDGIPIRALINPPILFMKKAPPADGSGIFVDRSEEVLILDLDEIQNYPQQGVILANYPLLIRGTAQSPLAIICSENIYIENLNPSQEGEPVLLASRRGVWVYRRSDQSENPIHGALIYSPLRALYTVLETGDFANPPVSIHGSAVFSGDYAWGTMDMAPFAKNYFYDIRIPRYMKTPPFSYFPLPIEVQSIRR